MPLPYTIINNTNPDASKLQANFEWLAGVTRSLVRAYSTGNQTISASTTNKITFAGESFDLKGEFDSATNYRFTATTAGYYLIHVNVYSNNLTPVIYIYKNGTEIARRDSDQVLTDIVSLAVNDYIEAWYNNNSGSTVTLFAGSGGKQTFIDIFQLV